jgi:hypothetical protein
VQKFDAADFGRRYQEVRVGDRPVCRSATVGEENRTR